MDLCRLFNNLRNNFLSSLKAEDRVKESEGLKDADEIVARLLRGKSKDRDIVRYIQNNRLMGYYVYLNEQGMLESINKCEGLERNVYERLQKLLNTINYLSVIGKKLNTKFLLIKSLNVLPYLPVYDVDILMEDPEMIVMFEDISDIYVKSKEEEENKYNFLPRDRKNFFKLSFHTDITWDGVKVEKYSVNHIWKDNIQVAPYVSINSPIVEALVRVQESLLERLYITLMDYLFLSNYLQKSPHSEMLENFPKFIEFRNLRYSKGKLLLKNLSRWIGWQIYYLGTGKVPFHEK